MPKNYSSELEELLVAWQNNHVDHAHKLMENMSDVIKDHKGYGDINLWLLPIIIFPKFFHSAMNSGMKNIDRIIMTNLRSQNVILNWMTDPSICEFMVENNYNYFNDMVTQGFHDEMYNDIDDSNVQIILEYMPISLRKQAEHYIDQQNNMNDNDYASLLNHIRNTVQTVKNKPMNTHDL